MANNLNNNFHNLRLQINNDEYWDFFLNKDSIDLYYPNKGLQEKCLISYIDSNDPDCVHFDNLYSKRKYYWLDAITDDINLCNIGYVGMDNGFIHFRKDRITNDEFLKLFTSSHLLLKKEDKILQLHQVTGNTMQWEYPLSTIMNDKNIQTIKLNGGFYQGFFKLYKDNYQVLPDKIKSDWLFEFTLNKRDFEPESNKTLNDTYPNNKGIFFYMGTRAENKWWYLYGKTDSEYYEKRCDLSYFEGKYTDDDYEITPDDLLNNSYFEPYKPYIEKSEPYAIDGYFSDECPNVKYEPKTEYIEEYHEYCEDKEQKCILMPTPNWLNYYESYYDCGGNIHKPSNNNKNDNGYLNYCSCDWCENNCGNKDYINTTGYFGDNFLATENYVDLSRQNSYAIDEDYIKEDMFLDENMVLKTCEGYNLNEANVFEIKTDNKFLFFNQTPTGFTVNTYDRDSTIILTGQSPTTTSENYFLLFNRTPTGYTVNDIDNVLKSKINSYKLYKDITGNALAFRITDDGRIGYRYLVLDCDNDNRVGILEEYSSLDIIKNDEWNVIDVRIKMLTPIEDIRCYDRKRKMKIYFYVNGKLKFISKELPEFSFRELNDLKEKQEGVPYNISLGGGTQGLGEMIMLNYHKLPEYVLPLEKNFAGTFIGELKSFKFYDCVLNYSEIVNNVEFEKNSIK